MFAQLTQEEDACACYACFVYGPRVVCHNRWRPQTVDPSAEQSSGWSA